MLVRTQRKKKKSKASLIIIIAVIVVIIGVVGFIIYQKKFGPVKTYTDYNVYYNLEADPSIGRDTAAADEIAIVLEDEILNDSRAILKDGHVYVEYSVVKTNLDNRFYFDANEEVGIVTNATDLVMAYAGEDSYTVNGETKNVGYPVVMTRRGTAYFEMDFVSQYSNAVYGVYENPGRVYIRYELGDAQFATAKKGATIRVLGGVKANIVTKEEEATSIRLIEDVGGWWEVVDATGYLGYIKESDMTDVHTETFTASYDEPEYTSLSTGESINMGWHPVYSYGGNDTYYEVLYNVTGLNVISPTWYELADGEGGLTSFSMSDYVSRAHDDGMLVWPMFGDADYDFVESMLTHTSYRQRVEDTLVNDLKEAGADGINLDFERIYSDYGEDFIQFIRELSIRFRKEGLYLTVANYAPYDFNSCYHVDEQGVLCDYVIIMAYDNYVGTGEYGANAGLPFVKEVVEMSLEKVDKSKLVMAMPMYTRFWIVDGDGNLTRQEFGMNDAYSICYNYGAEITWDSEQGTDYATYTSDDKTVYVWLECPDSIEAKCELFSEYGVAGVASWRLGQEQSGVWERIGKYY